MPIFVLLVAACRGRTSRSRHYPNIGI